MTPPISPADEFIHISGLDVATACHCGTEKLLSSDGPSLKTKNITTDSLRDYANSPWVIRKFIVSEAQLLATTASSPVILLPPSGTSASWIPAYGWLNTLKTAVTNPANPLVVAGGEQLKIGWWQPDTSDFVNSAFELLDVAEYTNATTQVTHLNAFVPLAPIVQLWGVAQGSAPLSINTAFAVGPDSTSGAGAGWITGQGYLEIELMYALIDWSDYQ